MIIFLWFAAFSSSMCKMKQVHGQKTSYEELVEYLINLNAYDWKEMRVFRALCAYNYVQNGWLGDLYHFKFDSITYVICPAGLGRASSISHL